MTQATRELAGIPIQAQDEIVLQGFEPCGFTLGQSHNVAKVVLNGAIRLFTGYSPRRSTEASRDYWFLHWSIVPGVLSCSIIPAESARCPVLQ